MRVKKIFLIIIGFVTIIAIASIISNKYQIYLSQEREAEYQLLKRSSNDYKEILEDNAVVDSRGISVGKYNHYIDMLYLETIPNNKYFDYLYIEKCGVSNSKFRYCTIDNEEVAYKMTSTTDTTKIEVYVYNSDTTDTDYYISEIKKNDYIHLYRAIIDENNIAVYSELVKVNSGESIEYYEQKEGKIISFDYFSLKDDKHYEYLEFDQTYNDWFEKDNLASFYNKELDVTYGFSRNKFDNELESYYVNYYNDRHLLGYGYWYDIDEYVFKLEYVDNTVSSITVNADYVDGWAAFYKDTCNGSNSTPETLLKICDLSTYGKITILIEDYPDVSIDDLLSLEFFDFTFEDYSMTDINDANTYFFSNYDTIDAEFGFDYLSRDTTQYDIYLFFNIDASVINKLKD